MRVSVWRRMQLAEGPAARYGPAGLRSRFAAGKQFTGLFALRFAHAGVHGRNVPLAPFAGWPPLAAGRRLRIANAPYGSRFLAGGSAAAHELRPPAQRVESRSSVVARCANVLTNAPSARSLRHSILPCGACSRTAAPHSRRRFRCAHRPPFTANEKAATGALRLVAAFRHGRL